jgi:multiple sugar transport system permease protein
MMIPGAVTMIPVFVLLRVMPEVLNKIFSTDFWSSDLYIGSFFVGKPIGIDSYFALIVPGFFSAYGTFMLRQFFMGIPKDLEDAARIDGCTKMGTYFRIILPLSKPALATLTIFTFMGSWRNFMWPLIVTNSMELKTLPIMLASFQGLYTTDWTLLMAGSIIVMAPVLVVFILGQRFFISGIRLGAIKG